MSGLPAPAKRYLARLSAELRVDKATKQLILAEVGDHLREAIARDGSSDVRGVLARFGSAEEVAARLSRQHPVSPPGGSSTGGRPRTPGVVYAALVVVVLVLMATLALTFRQPPPPTIAEFAPQAVDQITDSPSDQASSSGVHGGTGTSGALETPPVPSPTPIDVARVRRCVGNPPRQIEDPQSPPCVPYWEGDNGGSTFRGITKDSIKVTAFHEAGRAPEEGIRVMNALSRFFNARFEFYGRKLNIERAPKNPWAGNCAQRAAGPVAVVNEYKSFAVITEAAGPCFYDAAARHKLLVTETVGSVGEKELRIGRPYLWQYARGANEQFRPWGRWVCQRLAGKPASYAADVTYRTRQRTFGFIAHATDGPLGYDTSDMKREIERCGEKLVVNRTIVNYEGKTAEFQQETVNAVLELKANNVTTAIISTTVLVSPAVPSTASSNGYFPEWILANGLHGNLILKYNWPQSEQRASLLGFFTSPEHVPYKDAPMNWALGEADDGFQSTDTLSFGAHDNYYHALLLLASGVQMAGPKLTPETFEQALHRTTFPNPPTPPIQAGHAGFPNGVHNMTHDSVAGWWSETAPGPYPDEGTGAWCYAEGGRRYKESEWTKGPDGLFGPVCDTIPAALR